MKRRKKNPVFVGALFVVALLVAGRSLLGLRGETAGGGAADQGMDGDFVDPAAEKEVGREPEWIDLLPDYGSYQRGDPVRLAFSSFDRNASAAPAGESAASTARWAGDDPPELRLSVVMVSAASQKAVLGGCIVGVGSTVGEVKVDRIERDQVSVSWRGRTLTYDLQDGWPREFRAEAERRRLVREDAEPTPAENDTGEQGQGRR